MELGDLPGLNAVLNGTCFLVLILGLIFIKKGKKGPHKLCMLTSLVLSVVFLSSYVYYHINFGSKCFTGTGSIRTLYFAILISHTALAILNVPMVIITFNHAFRENWDKHKKMARITFPIWTYVSLTGVLVYMFLYRWFPS